MSSPTYVSPVESWSPSPEDLARFWGKIREKAGRPENPCWVWMGDKAHQIRWGALGTRESVLRVSYFIQHGVWPDAPVRRQCEEPQCLRHVEVRPDLVERRRGNPLPPQQSSSPIPARAERVKTVAAEPNGDAEPIQCSTCRKLKPQTSYYARKDGGYLQPCRNCYQARAKKRDVKAAELQAGKNVTPGACTCGCPLFGHRSNGKGPCNKCGSAKCPSFFERGL